MRKPIFESEEDVHAFVNDCIYIDKDLSTMDDIIISAKMGGWIKRSPVEDAEEAISEIYPALKKWAEINNDKPNFCIRNSSVLEIIEGYIFLKKQLEEKDK